MRRATSDLCCRPGELQIQRVARPRSRTADARQPGIASAPQEEPVNELAVCANQGVAASEDHSKQSQASVLSRDRRPNGAAFGRLAGTNAYSGSGVAVAAASVGWPALENVSNAVWCDQVGWIKDRRRALSVTSTAIPVFVFRIQIEYESEPGGSTRS